MSLIGPEVTFLVFAKAPVAGEVKTRLAPLLGAEGAAALHARLVRHTLATVRALSDRVVLYCAPDVDDPFFAQCSRDYQVALEHQCRGDLGVRMLHACIDHLKPGTAVVIVGADAPSLDAMHLGRSVLALTQGAHVALAPAEDGGYALIALRRCAPELFEDMPWGSGAVMQETRARLQRLGWRWEELDAVWDVDRPEDYERLRREGWLDVLPQ
jgi:rSAM/selenodomain-associated transferase 1